jgi:hypothetical protein
MAAANARAVDDPFVAGIHPLCEIVVADSIGRKE